MGVSEEVSVEIKANERVETKQECNINVILRLTTLSIVANYLLQDKITSSINTCIKIVETCLSGTSW